MSIAIITGSAGLIGSEAASFLHDKGMSIVGIDNDLRSYFFGTEASTTWKAEELKTRLRNYKHWSIDIRDSGKIFKLFEDLGRDISLIVHAAAQPSHDWAAKEPFTDFTVNANGTLVMLEATRRYCPDAVFIFHRRTRSMATGRTACLWSKWIRDGRSTPIIPTSTASMKTCPSTIPCTACLESAKRQPISWRRNTGDTSV